MKFPPSTDPLMRALTVRCPKCRHVLVQPLLLIDLGIDPRCPWCDPEDGTC